MGALFNARFTQTLIGLQDKKSLSRLITCAVHFLNNASMKTLLLAYIATYNAHVLTALWLYPYSSLHKWMQKGMEKSTIATAIHHYKAKAERNNTIQNKYYFSELPNCSLCTITYNWGQQMHCNSFAQEKKVFEKRDFSWLTIVLISPSPKFLL